LDGSGSLGIDAFEASKNFAAKFAEVYDQGDSQISVILFSGPRYWSQYKRCAKNVSAELTETILQDWCGISLVQPLSNDTTQTVATIQGLEYPGGSTFTSGALDLAKNVLAFARPDAERVAVLLTDGVPIDRVKTNGSAKALREDDVRLVVVPIQGRGLSRGGIEDLKKLASRNVDDNTVNISDFHELEKITGLNTLVEDVCGSGLRWNLWG